jgi:phenylalanyl-tRNA synthetase beta chain
VRWALRDREDADESDARRRGVLLITDANWAVGRRRWAADTRVTDATTRVFRSAHFAPSAIIGRSRKLGLHTDASHRFERGVDPQLPRYALERATALIQQIMGGVAGPISEATLPEHLPTPQPVRLRRARLARVLGIAVNDSEVERILRALGMVAPMRGWRCATTLASPSKKTCRRDPASITSKFAHWPVRSAWPCRARPGERTTLRRQLAAHDYVEAINHAFRWQLLATWS